MFDSQDLTHCVCVRLQVHPLNNRPAATDCPLTELAILKVADLSQQP